LNQYNLDQSFTKLNCSCWTVHGGTTQLSSSRTAQTQTGCAPRSSSGPLSLSYITLSSAGKARSADTCLQFAYALRTGAGVTTSSLFVCIGSMRWFDCATACNGFNTQTVRVLRSNASDLRKSSPDMCHTMEKASMWLRKTQMQRGAPICEL
jgi:hypothetical protein